MDELVPSQFYLSQNYPNPFSKKTIIKYCVAYETRVKLEVFREGRLIKKLVDEEKDAGTYEIEFDNLERERTQSRQCETLSYQLIAGNYKSEKKMIISK